MSSTDFIEKPVSTSLHSSQLINIIKNLLHECRFKEAENILMGRENEMKTEIENLRMDLDSMKGEVCLLERTVDLNKLEKLKLEEKLQQNEKKCEELDERVTCLLEEKKVSSDREKRLKERYDKILVENTVANNNFILELMEKVDELKDINLESERLVGVYKEKYKRSDMKIVEMDKEIEGLKHEGLTAAKMMEELRREIVKANNTIDELKHKKLKSDLLAEDYKSGIEILSPRTNMRGEDLGDTLTAKVRDVANIFNGVCKLKASEEGSNLGFMVSKGKNVSSGNDSTPGDRKSVQPRTKEDDDDDAHNTVRISQSDRNPPQPESAHASGTRLLMSGAGRSSKIERSFDSAGDVIEILDSDDEADPDGAADISNVGKNQMNFVQSPTCSQRSKRDRTNFMDDLFAKSTTKRKRNICTTREDNILIHEKEKEVLKSSHDRLDCYSSWKCGEEAGPKCDSQTPLEKFNGSNDELTRGAGCRLGHDKSSSARRTALDHASSSSSLCHTCDDDNAILDLGGQTTSKTILDTPSEVGTSGGAPKMPPGLQRDEVHLVAGKLHCASAKLSTIFRKIIEKEFDSAGWTFRAVPDHMRNSWWTMFQNYCCWDVDRYREVDVKMLFFKGMQDKYGKRLNEYKQTHARTGKRPTFIDENVWRAWETEWNKPENKAKSDKCSANRRSEPSGPSTGISKHIGGSKSAIDHSLDIEREKGRPATMYEVFIRMHRKPDGTFVDRKSMNTAEEFQRRLDEARASLQDPNNEIDEDLIYCDVVGSKKGKHYGTGCFGELVASSKGFRNSSSSQHDRGLK